jgi:hypothetical protein
MNFSNTPPQGTSIQNALVVVEVEVHQEHATVHDWEVYVEIGNSDPDMGSSHARDTKFLKTIDLYWHIKTFMGKIMLDSEEDKEEIMEQLAEVC